ncbi:MAG: sialidase family protein [Bryobacteraceae bacterium]
MTRKSFLLLLPAPLLPGQAAPEPYAIENVVVYRQPGRYGGWPANHGIWSWGNEILAGFEAGYFKFDAKRHSIDRSKPAEHLLARSLDGGASWTIERPMSLLPPPATVVAGVPAVTGTRQLTDCAGGIDFTRPGFALTARMSGKDTGPSWFFYTTNKGKTWNGPYRLPDFGTPGVAARTDYLIDGDHVMTMFLTVAKANRNEGRVICVRTENGAKTWKLISYIGPEPPAEDYAIMPSSVRLSAQTIVTSIRHKHFIDLWRSGDNGATWQHVSKPVEDTGIGNPPSMVKLKDGRLALTYGYRAKPYSIRARISSDAGRTWSPDIVLRDDAGAWDIGYTRTVVRPDGNLVTVYYYNLDAHAERFIGATIWSPGRE